MRACFSVVVLTGLMISTARAQSADELPEPATPPPIVATPTPAPPAPAASPTPARSAVAAPVARPTHWEILGGSASQGVFDPGIHMFAPTSWIHGFELDAVRSSNNSDSVLSLSPEAGYALLMAGRTLAPGTSSNLSLHRLEAGVRARARMGELSLFARAGALGVLGSAYVEDPYRGRTRNALTGGGFVSAGLGAALTDHVEMTIEAGHTRLAPLSFGSWGRLEVDGANVTATIGARF